MFGELVDAPLDALPALVVDVQATGAGPEHGHLVEVGWATLAEGAVEAHLVRLPQGAPFPGKVAELTGLPVGALREAALGPREVVDRLLDAVPAEPLLVVAHHAGLERRFLGPLAEARGRALAFLDTHALARRLHPELPRCGLRPLAGLFAAPLGPHRRAGPHVAATRALFARFRQDLAAVGVETLHELGVLLARKARRRAYAFPMERALRLGLARGPGVYQLLRRDGSVLYVGKARCLRTRVNGHFRGRRGGARGRLEMLTQAVDLKVEATATELEAALLESERIKDLEPTYNEQLQPGPVFFLDPALRDARPAPDRAHPVGPVRDPRSLLLVGRLLGSLREGAPWTASGGPFEPPPELLAGAARVLCEGRPTPRRPDDLLIGAEVPKDVDQDGDGWTLASAGRWLEEALADAARQRRRARWLLRLTDAALAFRADPGRRVLVVEAGRIRERHWLAADDELPSPAPRSGAARRACFTDLRVYDRLRVLTTELRRLEKERRDPAVRVRRGPPLSGVPLGRLLRRV